jgi:hypothetical protein
MKKYSLVSDIVSTCTLLLFLYTGIDKLSRHNDFLLALAVSPVLKPYAAILSRAIPLLELLIAGLLFFPLTRIKGLYSSLILLLLFTAYLAWMLLNEKILPCTCGGFIEKLSWPQHLAFNAVLMSMISTGIILNKRKAKRKERPPT